MKMINKCVIILFVLHTLVFVNCGTFRANLIAKRELNDVQTVNKKLENFANISTGKNMKNGKFVTYQIINSETSCPEGQVLDYNRKCVEEFLK